MGLGSSLVLFILQKENMMLKATFCLLTMAGLELKDSSAKLSASPLTPCNDAIFPNFSDFDASVADNCLEEDVEELRDGKGDQKNTY